MFTFLTHPGAGRLLFGGKGRPELGTGVLGRVMREMNRRTDVGVRWSIPGVRAVLMVKLQRKYAHGQWSPTPVTEQRTQVGSTSWPEADVNTSPRHRRRPPSSVPSRSARYVAEGSRGNGKTSKEAPFWSSPDSQGNPARRGLSQRTGLSRRQRQPSDTSAAEQRAHGTHGCPRLSGR